MQMQKMKSNAFSPRFLSISLLHKDVDVGNIGFPRTKAIRKAFMYQPPKESPSLPVPSDPAKRAYNFLLLQLYFPGHARKKRYSSRGYRCAVCRVDFQTEGFSQIRFSLQPFCTPFSGFPISREKKSVCMYYASAIWKMSSMKKKVKPVFHHCLSSFYDHGKMNSSSLHISKKIAQGLSP